ncbi:hypothetical protein QEN19_003936 [Hanseniaspora menglaensis]
MDDSFAEKKTTKTKVADDNHQPRTKKSSRFDIFEDIKKVNSSDSISSQKDVTPNTAAAILGQPHQITTAASKKKRKTLLDQVHIKQSSSSISPGQLYTTESGRLFHAGKILIVLVGLPARSKTKLGVALTRYTRWLGVKSQIFHVSDYRRKMFPSIEGDGIKDLEYLCVDSTDKDGIAYRRQFINDCLKDIDNFFFDDQSSQIAIYDALNITAEERSMLNEKYSKGTKGDTKANTVLFIESIVTDFLLLERNIEIAISSKDYASWDKVEVRDHFLKRIERNSSVYEEISSTKEAHLSFVKYINYGDMLCVNNSNHSYLINKIISFLMNLKEKKGRVYLSRCGNSDFDQYNDDEVLNEEGIQFAGKLTNVVINRINSLRATHINQRQENGVTDGENLLFDTNILKTQVSVDRDLNKGKTDKKQISSHDGADEDSVVVFSAPRKRTYDTAQFFQKKGIPVRKKLELKQLNPGVIADMSLKEVSTTYPQEFSEFLQAPYFYRFSKGESYHDLALRMGSLIFEIERMNGDVLIIAHESALRIVYGYLMAKSSHDIPLLEFDRKSVIEISFGHYENKAVTLPIN